jgi:hypothetical protein
MMSIARALSICSTSLPPKKMIGAGTIKLASGIFLPDVLIYQACLAFGVYYSHTVPLLYSLRAEITSRVLAFEELDAVVERTPATDPIFKHLAQDLCHRRLKYDIGDFASFQNWLDCKSRAAMRNLMAEMTRSTGRGVGCMRGDRLRRWQGPCEEWALECRMKSESF